MDRTLHNLGVHFGTNKTDEVCTWHNKSYLDYYQKYFEPLRHTKMNILELGVKNGQSVKLWNSYFPNSKIFGLDIDPHCKQFEENGIQIEVGSQDDPNAIQRITDRCGDKFDIIIDDASHLNTLIIKSFDLLFPNLRSGGLYIMEDLRNCYDDLTGVEAHWPGMSYTKALGIDFKNERSTMDEFFLKLIKNMDYHVGEIESIAFYPMIAIITKV